MNFAGVFRDLKMAVSVPESEWILLSRSFSEISFSKGENFILQGDKPGPIGVVLSGLFVEFTDTSDGKRHVRDFSCEGDLIGSYSSLLMKSPLCEVSIEALEDSVIITMPFDTFTAFYDRHSSWEKLGRLVAEHCFIKRERREFDFLRYNAAERFEAFKGERRDLLNRVPRHMIASHLGVTPVSLSRLSAKKRVSKSID
jgi:CRP-like cAMP-binding protein